MLLLALACQGTPPDTGLGVCAPDVDAQTSDFFHELQAMASDRALCAVDDDCVLVDHPDERSDEVFSINQTAVADWEAQSAALYADYWESISGDACIIGYEPQPWGFSVPHCVACRCTIVYGFDSVQTSPDDDACE